MSDRFTAIIKIVKVTETSGTGLSVRGQRDAAPTSTDTELASIVVRNIDLASLITKTKAHLDLVEDAK